MKKDGKTGKQRGTDNDDFRTHLANERTFLSWCRTSLSLVVMGFVVERFDLFLALPAADGMGGPGQAVSSEIYIVAMFSFLLAGIIILISGYRFLSVRRMIRSGDLSVTAFPEVMVVLSMVAIVTMSILLMLK